jgi:hypothetical protein
VAELPSDPEQLARQILSGRVSIQQLAQEQARRRAAGQAQSAIRPSPPPGQAYAQPSPPRPPAARAPTSNKPTAYQQPRQPVRPAVRTVPFPAPPPRGTKSPSSRSVPAARVRQPAVAPGRPRPGESTSRAPQPPGKPGGAKPIAGGAKPIAGGAKPATGGATAASVQGPAAAKTPAPVPAPGTIAAAMLQDRRYLRSAFILTEILGRPLALRRDSDEY